MHIRTHISRLVGCVLLMASLIGCGVNDTTAQTGATSIRISAPTTLQPTTIDAPIEPRATTTPQPPKVTPTSRPGIAKATRLALNAQQTAQVPYSHPTRIPRPTLDPEVWGTPVPEGYIPENVKKTFQLEKSDVAGVAQLQGATSIWQHGIIQTVDHKHWTQVHIYANIQNGIPVIVPWLFKVNDPQTYVWEYTFPDKWKCPRPIGAITITTITEEPLGIVSFTSESGTSGTLNMATGAWTFSS